MNMVNKREEAARIKREAKEQLRNEILLRIEELIGETYAFAGVAKDYTYKDVAEIMTEEFDKNFTEDNIKQIVHRYELTTCAPLEKPETTPRKPAATKKEKYNISCDIYLMGVLNWNIGKYKKWKADCLSVSIITIRKYYDDMFNSYLPKMEIENTFPYDPELLALDAKDSDYRNYE